MSNSRWCIEERYRMSSVSVSLKHGVVFSEINGQWSVVIGNKWSVVIGNKLSVVSGHRELID